MKVAKSINNRPVNRFWKIIRYGMLLYGITNRLARIGIEIAPYYWVKEGRNGYNPPLIKGSSAEYTTKYLDQKELEKICLDIPGFNTDEMITGMKNGQLCVGLMHQGQCVAFMFIELNDFVFRHRTFQLANDEAYLLNMWTLHAYRGKNIAPYLRYQCYLLLAEMGRGTPYSITAYFNKSSRRFKEKLQAKNLNLYLYIGFFKKFHWNFLLKNYVS